MQSSRPRPAGPKPGVAPRVHRCASLNFDGALGYRRRGSLVRSPGYQLRPKAALSSNRRVCWEALLSKKALIWVGLTVGSAIGGYLPALWGGDLISFSSVVFSAAGGIVGIWLGYRFGE